MSLVIACGITPIVRRAASGFSLTSYPVINALPLVIGISVVIIRINVLLPAPLGPSSPKISPSFTSKVTPLTASKSPYFFTMFSTAMAWPSCPEWWPLLRVKMLIGFPFQRCPLLAIQKTLRKKDLGRHSRDVSLPLIVDEQLQPHRANIALRPAVVALRRKVCLRCLGNNLAGDALSSRHTHIESVAQLHGLRLRLRNRRVHPGLRQIDDGHNWCSHAHHFAFARCSHAHRSIHRRGNSRVVHPDFCSHQLGVRRIHLPLRRSNVAVRRCCLIDARLHGVHCRLRGIHLFAIRAHPYPIRRQRLLCPVAILLTRNA